MKPTYKTASYAHHLSAYAWACAFIRAKRVLEIGCGEGFGMVMMSWFATSVRGIDIAKVFLQRAAKRHYGCPSTIEFLDVETELLLLNEDVVIAFEVLEHLKDPRTLLAHIAGNGKALIFSVPHNRPHPLHLTNFNSLEDVQLMVEPYFAVDWYYMRGAIIQKTPFKNPDRYMGIGIPK